MSSVLEKGLWMPNWHVPRWVSLTGNCIWPLRCLPAPGCRFPEIYLPILLLLIFNFSQACVLLCISFYKMFVFEKKIERKRWKVVTWGLARSLVVKRTWSHAADCSLNPALASWNLKHTGRVHSWAPESEGRGVKGKGLRHGLATGGAVLLLMCLCLSLESVCLPGNF